MNTLAKIEALEATLAAAIAARPVTIAALQKRQVEAEATLESFASNPVTAQFERALKAHTDATAAQALLARLGENRPWTDMVQSQWTRENHAALCELLEKLINERVGGRQAFRDAAGQRLGELTCAVVKADGDNAPDATLTALNGQLAAIEDDLAARERRLRNAQDALRNFQRASEEMPNAYEPNFKKWLRARDAARSVDFEKLSEVPLCPEARA